MLTVSSISPMSTDNEVIFHCITGIVLQGIKRQITRPLFHFCFNTSFEIKLTKDNKIYLDNKYQINDLMKYYSVLNADILSQSYV